MKYKKSEAHYRKYSFSLVSLFFVLVFMFGTTSCMGDLTLFNPTSRSKNQSNQSIVNNERLTILSAAEARNFHIGTVVQARYLREEKFSALVKEQFNTIVPESEMKFETIHPQPEVYNFEPADEIASFAKENHLYLRGHTLVWEQQLPQWVLENSLSKNEYKEALKNHIFNVVGHYKGQVYAWDVVNEAFDENGLFRNTIWLRTIGPEYIALSFKWAHEADPNALLFYNDFPQELSGKKAKAIYALAEGLLAQGVPIHGIGIQLHTSLNAPPDPEKLSNFIADINDLGLKTHISEMDVGIDRQISKQDLENALERQALIYYQTMKTCVDSPDCDTLIVWGLTDAYTWRQGTSPTLFDERGEAKPAYYAVLDVLSK